MTSLFLIIIFRCYFLGLFLQCSYSKFTPICSVQSCHSKLSRVHIVCVPYICPVFLTSALCTRCIIVCLLYAILLFTDRSEDVCCHDWVIKFSCHIKVFWWWLFSRFVITHLMFVFVQSWISPDRLWVGVINCPLGHWICGQFFLLYPTFFVGRQQTIVYLLYDSLVFYCLY